MKLVAPAFALKKSAQGVLRFSPSGALLAQVTSRVVVWDVRARKELASFKAIPNEHFVAFHEPTQRLAIKNANGEIVFTDLSTGAVVSGTGKFREFRMGCQPWFSPDGTSLLDGGAGGKLLLWDVATATARRQWDLGAHNVDDIAHSPASGLYACLLSVAGSCSLALLEGDLSIASPRLFSPADFGIDPAQWWEAGQLAFSPCGTKLALVAKTQARENLSRIYALDLQAPALVHVIDVGDDPHGWAGSLSWSQQGQLALVFHENPWRQGMSTPEYEAIRDSRPWDCVHVLDATTGQHLRKTYINGVNRAAFRPGGSGLALNCTRFPGAYLPDFHSVPAFAESKADKTAKHIP